MDVIMIHLFTHSHRRHALALISWTPPLCLHSCSFVFQDPLFAHAQVAPGVAVLTSRFVSKKAKRVKWAEPRKRGRFEKFAKLSISGLEKTKAPALIDFHLFASKYPNEASLARGSRSPACCWSFLGFAQTPALVTDDVYSSPAQNLHRGSSPSNFPETRKITHPCRTCSV